MENIRQILNRSIKTKLIFTMVAIVLTILSVLAYVIAQSATSLWEEQLKDKWNNY